VSLRYKGREERSQRNHHRVGKRSGEQASAAGSL